MVELLKYRSSIEDKLKKTFPALLFKVLATCLIVGVGSFAAADTVPLGGEFTVDTYWADIYCSVDLPAVSVAPDGSFVFFWFTKWKPDPVNTWRGVRGRYYDSSGNPQGSDFGLFSIAVGGYGTWSFDIFIRRVGAATRTNGTFVMTMDRKWSTYEVGEPARHSYSQIFHRTNQTGASVGDTTVDSGSSSSDETTIGLSVAARADNEATFAWGKSVTGGDAVVWAQTFDEAGIPVGSAQVVGYDYFYLDQPVVAASPSNYNFMVVWASTTSGGDDSAGTSIQARHFLADGTPAAQIQINTDTAGDQRQPAVAAGPSGFGHAAVWITSCDVRTRVFRTDVWGEPAGDEVIVYDGSVNQCAMSPAVTALTDGSYQVVWEKYNQDDLEGPRTIQGQQLLADGTLLNSVINISSTGGTNRHPEIASSPGNGFIVSWRKGDDWFSNYAIRGRRYGDDSFLFRGDFETGNTNNWSLVVQNLAESFNELVADRGITGDYILCEYEPETDTYSYLGTSFSGADGGLGGAAIASLTTLYWKNENLASTVAPFGSQDADGDDVINFIDVDALNPAVS